MRNPSIFASLLRACMLGWVGMAPVWVVPAYSQTGNATPSASSTTTLPPQVLQALASSGLPASALSVWVQAVEARAPLLAYRADEPRLMASVMKTMTTGVALQRLGPAFTWRTDVALRGSLDAQGRLDGDVLIRGSGDPSLDGERLLSWLQQWQAAGLRDIRGKVLVDEQVFDLPAHDPAAFDGAPLKPYNAGPRGWLLAHGATSLVMQPLPGTDGVQVSLNPPLSGVSIAARVKGVSGPCGDWRSRLGFSLQRQASQVVVAVQGVYPLACGTQGWPFLWPEEVPGEHANRAWAAAWAAQGGQWQGHVLKDMPRSVWPNPAPPVWQSWTSPPLSDVIHDINKFSNNVMARQLFLTLGRLSPDGTWLERATLAQARQVVQQHVIARTQTWSPGACQGQALQLDNGAGLSRTEAATARCMGAWLMALWHDPWMPEWVASLPIAGVDGTARRMPAATGRAHLKTGSLDDVMAIAGVMQRPAGDRWIVVAVINHPKAEAARGVMASVLQWLDSEGNAP